jgi:hypothetical protein
MRSRAILFALIGAAPAGLLVAALSVRSVHRFFDPCLQWGVGALNDSGNVTAYVVLPPGGQGPCAKSISTTPETKAQALTLLVLVNGGILIGSALGVVGALRSLPWLSVFAAAIMFCESIVVFSIFPLTLLAGGFFLLAARETASHRRR